MSGEHFRRKMIRILDGIAYRFCATLMIYVPVAYFVRHLNDHRRSWKDDALKILPNSLSNTTSILTVQLVSPYYVSVSSFCSASGAGSG